MEKIDTMLDSIGIPEEPPKGSFYDITPDEEKKQEPASQSSKKRKRGGQPGNQNARKHGLYSKHLPSQKASEYDSVLAVRDLSPEIALLRFKIMELLNDPEASHDHLIKSLNTLARLTDIQERHLYLVR